MTAENRKRLTALVAAGTKLTAAANLVKEAALNMASSGLMPREHVQKIAAELDAEAQRIAITIERIP